MFNFLDSLSDGLLDCSRGVCVGGNICSCIVGYRDNRLYFIIRELKMLDLVCWASYPPP